MSYLSRLEKPRLWKRELEQYFTPIEIAADLLWNIYMRGELQNRTVADLGAGYGILGLGAALLGARKVYLVELDKELARLIERNANLLGVSERCEIIHGDAKKFSRQVDLVIQNPPFGIETRKGEDLEFLRVAASIAPLVYSMHHYHPRAIQTIISKFRKFYPDAVVSVAWIYEFHIPSMLQTHRRRQHRYKVAVLRVQRKGIT